MKQISGLVDTPLIPRSDLFGNPTRLAGRISPDAHYLSWVAPVDGVLNLWIAPREHPEAARALTHDRNRGIQSYAWAYDGQHLLYSQDRDGDENFHLYALHVVSGAVRDLTPFAGARGLLAGLSPRANLRGKVLVSLNHRDGRFADLFEIDILSGERVLRQENARFGGFLCDDQFRVRLAIQPEKDGGVVYLKPEGEDWRPWLELAAEDARNSGPSHIDVLGNTLYFFDTRNRDTSALVAFELDTERASTTPQVLAVHLHADISGVLTDKETYEPLAYTATYAKREFHLLSDSLRGDVDLLDAEIDTDWSVGSRSEDDRYWVIHTASDRVPGAAHLYDRHQSTLQPLYLARPELADAPLARMQATTITSRDGLALVSYLTLPVYADDPTLPLCSREPLPLVLVVHGGPWARDHFGFNSTHQWLANRGYAVLSVNFRGSTGFGKAFVEAGNLEWGAKMDDDLCDAVEWAVGRGIADPARIAIMGGSYGGYATLWAMTNHPMRYACGVDIVGPSDLETLLAAIPAHWESARATLYRAVGDPETEEGRTLLRERSPLHQAARIRRPLLIGQGANDPRVKQVEADQMVKAMQSNGIPVTYALYADEGHGFQRPPNRISFNALTEWFLSRHLGGRGESVRAEEIIGSSLDIRSGGDWANEIMGSNLQ